VAANVKHFGTPRFRWATCYVTICDMTAHVAERRGALSEVVAANVRAECARRGWHQGVVAERMGMARNAVSDRARGRTPWTLDEVAQLAVLFGVEVSELLARPAVVGRLARPARARRPDGAGAVRWYGVGIGGGGVMAPRHGAAVLQTISRGKPAYGWECPCGAGGGPFAALQTAATLAEDHEQRHARARELTVERFLTAPGFS